MTKQINVKPGPQDLLLKLDCTMSIWTLRSLAGMGLSSPTLPSSPAESRTDSSCLEAGQGKELKAWN